MVVDSRLSVVDVNDCAEGHLLAEARGAPGERYLLSGATLTVREAVALLGAIAGTRRATPAPAAPGRHGDGRGGRGRRARRAAAARRCAGRWCGRSCTATATTARGRRASSGSSTRRSRSRCAGRPSGTSPRGWSRGRCPGWFARALTRSGRPSSSRTRSAASATAPLTSASTSRAKGCRTYSSAGWPRGGRPTPTRTRRISSVRNACEHRAHAAVAGVARPRPHAHRADREVEVVVHQDAGRPPRTRSAGRPSASTGPLAFIRAAGLTRHSRPVAVLHQRHRRVGLRLPGRAEGGREAVEDAVPDVVGVSA